MKQNNNKYGLPQLKKDFPDDKSVLAFIFEASHSYKCSCGGHYSLVKGRKQYQCSKCRFQIAPLSGTIFHKSDTPLTLWLHAIWVFSNAKSGISAKELSRQLGVTYKTAWRILKLIREALGQNNDKLDGEVEMDETYFGGRFKSGRYNEKQREAIAHKSAIIGAVERNGKAKAKVSANLKAWTLGEFMRDYIESKAQLFTNESNRYNKVARGYNRQYVSHRKQEYAKGNVHTNTIEGLWSHFKRSTTGTHKSISKKYLQSYLDGFVFHYNNRHSDKERFSSLVGALLSA